MWYCCTQALVANDKKDDDKNDEVGGKLMLETGEDEEDTGADVSVSEEETLRLLQAGVQWWIEILKKKELGSLSGGSLSRERKN